MARETKEETTGQEAGSMTSIISKVAAENARHTFLNIYIGGEFAGRLTMDKEHGDSICSYLNNYNPNELPNKNANVARYLLGVCRKVVLMISRTEAVDIDRLPALSKGYLMLQEAIGKAEQQTGSGYETENKTENKKS